MARLLSLALAAAVSTAGVASADSYFTIIDRQDGRTILDLGTVVSDVDGVVEVRDARDTILGTTNVRAGANTNVRVDVHNRPVGGLVAYLLDGDQVLAQSRVTVDLDDRKN
ncbi:hypothetical protein [Histidinibacterium aquaticum]|uniref:DUF5666 domain-containing protein n=1 Tax=Histidinibacterium aquaticum TaxID=2613962 RepID=A0A5J5GBM6_9RHOB|nr:hypothetical protein [Histidinibacterium aquaticum]KAA9005202.1 hypothetical protein F3S47_18020 [Histidinibacterium aquaticum]